MIPEFIAWDKENREWLDENDYLINCNGTVGMVDETLFDDDIMERSKSVDLYQYIGRTDKNGNKVYAGSKVELYGGEGVVVYDEKYCRYTWNGQALNEVGYFGDGAVIGHIAEDK